MDLEIQLSAGGIKRYHTVPIVGEQTVGQHTYNVVQILRHITNDMLSVNLMKAALDHDVMEYFTGDMPHPTKNSFPPLYNALKAVEQDLLNELGVEYELDDREADLLKWADVMDAGIFAKYQISLGNRYAHDILNNVRVFFHGQVDMPERLIELVRELEGYDGGK